jgi:hypothetical protein
MSTTDCAYSVLPRSTPASPRPAVWQDFASGAAARAGRVQPSGALHRGEEGLAE